MTLSSQIYESLAEATLKALVHALDEVDSADFEAELHGDILSLEFADDTQYVINSHQAARQIWMAAERSAWHFDWVEDQQAWVAAKTGDELWATLERVLSAKLRSPVALARAVNPVVHSS